MEHNKSGRKYYRGPSKGEMQATAAKNKKKATLGPGAEGNKSSDAQWAPSSRYSMDSVGKYKRKGRY